MRKRTVTDRSYTYMQFLKTENCSQTKSINIFQSLEFTKKIPLHCVSKTNIGFHLILKNKLPKLPLWGS